MAVQVTGELEPGFLIYTLATHTASLPLQLSGSPHS